MVFIILIFALLIISVVTAFKNRDIKVMKEIRQTWGRKIEKYRNFNRISTYANNNQTPETYHLFSQTLKDIDIENLFSLLDRTVTGIGQQFLNKKLLFSSTLETLKKLTRR